MTAILIGTDPEVFVLKRGQFVSGHDLIPGTKENPHYVDGGAIQVDGVALEFNTNPAETADDFVSNIKKVMSDLKDRISLIDLELKIVIAPTATFRKEYFDSLPDEPKLLGCSPDYSAYTGKENIPPETTEPFRTGSGHIHIGWDYGLNHTSEEHMKLCCDFVKHLDSVLYLSSLLWDNDTKRRTLYGKIGAFRPKHYGVEYRPLSNAYLRNEKTQRFVFNTVKKLTDLFFNNTNIYEGSGLARTYCDSIRDGGTFSNSDIKAHLEFMRTRYGIELYE